MFLPNLMPLYAHALLQLNNDISDLKFCNLTGAWLERVPRVPGTRRIMSSYVMAPVYFYKISGEQLPGTRKIPTPLISGTRGLIFLTTALTIPHN